MAASVKPEAEWPRGCEHMRPENPAGLAISLFFIVALRVLVWVNFTLPKGFHPGNNAEKSLSFGPEIGHDGAMDTPRHLRDLYRFPGLLPSASVGVFPDDPDSIILPMRRRRKKQPADNVDRCIAASTINGHV